MIKEWVGQYHPRNRAEAVQAVREIMQEVALAALYRAGFFEKAAFYGGTALRVFHGLPRFSEGLDFSLLHEDQNFKLDPYFKTLQHEFQAAGLEISIKRKDKAKVSNIESAFLKPETLWSGIELAQTAISFPYDRVPLKIKLEVDTVPPLGFQTEEKLLLKPFSCYVKCFTLPDLFAGKLHALLFRKWKTRVKGRDWFDTEWYIKQGIPVNLAHLWQRAVQTGDWPETEQITEVALQALLVSKIEKVSFARVKDDVIRFIASEEDIEIWSDRYFKDLVKHLKTV